MDSKIKKMTFSALQINMSKNHSTLSQKWTKQLEKPPIHNLSSERSVSFLNNELKLRSTTQLASASSAQVKARSADLIENLPPGIFRHYYNVVKPGGRMPEIVKAWAMKRNQLLKMSMDSKEVANVSLDKRRHADLNILKEKGGPFTKPEEVDIFLARLDITDADKIKHLYFEIRYARDTSLSIPKTSDIFKL